MRLSLLINVRWTKPGCRKADWFVWLEVSTLVRLFSVLLPLDLRFRLAAAVQGVSGAAGTLSAVPFPTAGETQPVHLPAESLTLALRGKLVCKCDTKSL